MVDQARTRATGSCLCGAVRFTIRGPLRDVSYCHCMMCRRAASSTVAYTACATEDLEVADRGRKLKWYRSSPTAERGFCGVCGGQLFWRRAGAGRVSVSAGALDQPTGLRGGEHKHCDEVPDYEAAASGGRAREADGCD